MKLFFWGFLLVFLDFSLTFNGVGFDLLPDSVGYLLVFLGAGRMREESGSFSRMRPIALVLAIVNFAALIINPFGPIELNDGWPTTLAVIVYTLLMLFLYLYLLWLLVRGVQDMEQYYGCPFNAHTMRKAFIVTLCISITARFWLGFHISSCSSCRLVSPFWLRLLSFLCCSGARQRHTTVCATAAAPRTATTNTIPAARISARIRDDLPAHALFCQQRKGADKMKKLCTLHDAASNLIEDMAPNSGRIEWKRNRLGLSGGSIDTDLFNGLPGEG